MTCSKPTQNVVNPHYFFRLLQFLRANKHFLIKNCAMSHCCNLGRYIGPRRYSRDNYECSLYKVIKCRFHLYHRNWSSIFFSNGNDNLLMLPPNNGNNFQRCMILHQNNLNLMSLIINIIKGISYIDIYNMYIQLFIIKNIVKAKVVSRLNCVLFVYVLQGIWGEIPLQLPQRIP